MTLLNNQTRVLLPEWIVNKQPIIPENEYMELVLRYLKRYPEYHLEYVDDSYAVCIRPIQQKKRGKRK